MRSSNVTKAEGEHVEMLIEAASQSLIDNFFKAMILRGVKFETAYAIAEDALKNSGCPIELDGARLIQFGKR